MSKAQISTFDFYAALMIATVLITLIIVSLNNYSIKLAQNQDANEMLLESLQISDSFVKTFGNPTSWENDIETLNYIGLAEYDRILSKDKVMQFANFSYNFTQKYIKIYDYYFRILDYNGTELIIQGLIFNGTNSVTIRRHVIYDDEKAIMELTLWK